MSRHGSAMFAILLLAGASIDVRAIEAQGWSPGGGGTPDVQYIMDENGEYSGQKTTITGSGTSGTHYTCKPRSGGLRCRPCGECHTATQAASPTYVAKFDLNRHTGLHFPKLFARLAPEQKLPWGASSTVSYRDKRVVAMSLERIPRDLVYFPVGSTIVLNPRGHATFVVMPPTGVPVSAKR